MLDPANLLLRVVVVAGFMPVISNTVLHHASHVTGIHRFAAVPATFPRRGPLSYAALIIAAVGLLWISLPVPQTPAVPQANSEWITRIGLRPVAEFGFIRRYIGPGATLVRYRRPIAEPAVAIDVITTPNLARLRDYDNAVWYPSPIPVDYHPADLGGPVAVSARTLHTDADRASTQDSPNWFALTWVWHIGQSYQRVTVVVDQSLREGAPPDPVAVTWRNSLLTPLLWVTRQQPTGGGAVLPGVRRTAEAVAQQILAAGATT